MNSKYLNQMLPRTALLAALVLAGMVTFGGLAAKAQDAAQPAAPASSQDTAQAAPQPGQRTDGQVEMDVVHALDASRALKNDMITAATIQGEVTLSGTVSSEASRELAESIVSHVAGVTGVKNNLKVGNPQAAAMDPQSAPGSQQTAANEPDDSMAPLPPSSDGPGNVPGQAPYPGQAQAPSGQGQPPYPNQGQPPYPNQAQGQPYPDGSRPQYAPAPPRAPHYAQPTGPVTIPQGTLLQVRTSEIARQQARQGRHPASVHRHSRRCCKRCPRHPRGATVHGVVTEVKQAGDLGGSADLPSSSPRSTSAATATTSPPINSRSRVPIRPARPSGNTLGGALLGAIIGGAVGRGGGAAIGAGAGAAAGLGASAAEGGPRRLDSRLKPW
jgi:hypothetical protein